MRHARTHRTNKNKCQQIGVLSEDSTMAGPHHDLVTSELRALSPEWATHLWHQGCSFLDPTCGLGPRKAEKVHIQRQVDERAIAVAGYTCSPKWEACDISPGSLVSRGPWRGPHSGYITTPSPASAVSRDSRGYIWAFSCSKLVAYTVSHPCLPPALAACFKLS